MCRNIDKDQWIDVMALCHFFSRSTNPHSFTWESPRCFVLLNSAKLVVAKHEFENNARPCSIKHKCACFFLGRFAQRERAVSHTQWKIEQWYKYASTSRTFLSATLCPRAPDLVVLPHAPAIVRDIFQPALCQGWIERPQCLLTL